VLAGHLLHQGLVRFGGEQLVGHGVPSQRGTRRSARGCPTGIEPGQAYHLYCRTGLPTGDYESGITKPSGDERTPGAP
jgi:hypothetical protein